MLEAWNDVRATHPDFPHLTYYAVEKAWRATIDNDRLSVTTSFVQDPANNQLTREGDTPDQNYFNVVGGLQFILPNGWMPM